MRLKQIKLAGFKSFVDPTTVPFPAQMTAIVGPNGCGKSNIIDAVRWVLGESSAKNLRGDAMTDVIFNGATSRKPVSQASIELVFENTQGRIQGSLADRNEIAVKRSVNRESQSAYFLNGTKCRRRDITDIFLGTGLGPRSYAIIEQGMISRLIESRPQELRVFVEEAAGISKYKERRRETENRIRHTRDNLDRLHDVRDELATQLDKLKRQASAARRFKELKAHERQLKAELYAIRWLGFNERTAQLESQLAEQETALEAFIAEQRGGERGIVELKEQLQNLQQQHAQVQQQFYQLGNDITRLEQSILHQKQAQQIKTESLRKIKDDLHDVRSHHELEQARVEDLQLELDEVLPELAILEESKDTAQDNLHQAEEALNHWQSQWQLGNQETHRLEQSIQISRTRLQALENSQVKSQSQLEQLQQELAQGDDAQEQAHIQQLESQLNQQQAVVEEHQAERQQLLEQLHALDGESLAFQQQAQKLSQQLGQKDGEAASLQQLITQQVNAIDSAQFERLQQTLCPKGTLQELLQVEPGWEAAVHRVLYNWLDFFVVSNNLTLPHDEKLNVLLDSDMSYGPANTLASKVAAPKQFHALLASVQLADSAAIVMATRGQYQDGQSVISADGCWASANFVSSADHCDGVNVLLLRQQVEQLQLESEQLRQQHQAADQGLQQVLAQKQQLQDAHNQTDQSLQQAQSQWQQVSAELISCKQSQEHRQRRQQILQEQIAQLQQVIDDEAEEQTLLIDELQLAQEQLAEHQIEHEQALAQKSGLEARVQQNRGQLSQSTDALHQLAMQVQSSKAQFQSVKEGLLRSERQLLTLQEREQELLADLDMPEESVAEQGIELEMLLEQRVEVENQRNALADNVADIEGKLRDIEKGQHGVSQRSEEMRRQMEATRLELESTKVKANAVLEQFQDVGPSLRTILDGLSADADESEWQKQLDKTSSSISRLGAINLAAIEEYDVQAERKAYLDNQHEDLSSALHTLEEAIRKIDRETRARFKHTFEQVNTDFQNLFPKVFGGGTAYLALTDDDLLETGVTIMARPPGKKNSTIHLLSGGEKALTALSLVFAIFRLNPAPFCMLDEVDAPLDDVNVGRFCNLVKEMSQTVQFIYISHNKVAMEMASTLTGVTMQEPGVSRMVAVDVEEALSFAEAS